MIRLTLTARLQLLSWAGQHGDPQFQAAVAEVYNTVQRR